MVIFKSKQKKLEGDLKIKLCGKRLYPTESVKYLDVKIDTNLTWQHHVNDLFIKLNRANSLLFKVRKYVSGLSMNILCTGDQSLCKEVFSKIAWAIYCLP